PPHRPQDDFTRELPTGEDAHGPDYSTPVFLLPQLCNSTLFGVVYSHRLLSPQALQCLWLLLKLANILIRSLDLEQWSPIFTLRLLSSFSIFWLHLSWN
ncbi:hypothetical protein, partial [Corynebacterium propinquum]